VLRTSSRKKSDGNLQRRSSPQAQTGDIWRFKDQKNNTGTRTEREINSVVNGQREKRPAREFLNRVANDIPEPSRALTGQTANSTRDGWQWGIVHRNPAPHGRRGGNN